MDRGRVTKVQASFSQSAPAVDSTEIQSLFDAFEGRKRVFLVALIHGQSRTMAAASAGVTPRASQYWCANDSAFAEAAEAAERHGFATVIEAELYRRAMAGPGDRSSMRALELIVKAREPAYREKTQVDVEIDVATGLPAAIRAFAPLQRHGEALTE